MTLSVSHPVWCPDLEEGKSGAQLDADVSVDRLIFAVDMVLEDVTE